MMAASSCPPASTAPWRRSARASASRAIAVSGGSNAGSTGNSRSHRRRTRRARRRETISDPAAAAITMPADMARPPSFDGVPGNVYGDVSPDGSPARVISAISLASATVSDRDAPFGCTSTRTE